ncbi:Erythronolide synthase, modules 1 and 2 [Streptomyces sp. MP131-18]|nr:Erythronolide synthase, modules 1 and 2 [Streptomyces sp. MP131-18]
MLDVGDDQLQSVLPAVSEWRRRTRDRSTAASWLYQAVWEPLSGTSAARLEGTWLAVVPPDGGTQTQGSAASAVIRALAAAGADVRTLTVDPATGDRAAITEALSQAVDEAQFSGVLSLLALEQRPHPAHLELSAGVAGSLLLVQAMVDLGARRSGARLWCVTQGAVTLDEPGENPAQAQVWGIGQVAAVEHPEVWGGLVDLPGAEAAETVDDETRTDWLVRNLGAVLANEADEDQFALRPTAVHVRRMARVPLNASDGAEEWRPRGTVLITGGTGAVEAHVARWLADRGAEHLVLTDATAAEGAEATAESQRWAAEFGRLGVRVTVEACDPADRTRLAQTLKGLEAQGDTVRAVVHTAAMVELTALAETGLPQLARAVAAKALPAQHLEDLLDQSSLDAVVYFSSVAGFWGSGDHAAYAAANAHLDALSQRQRARGQAAFSAAWAVWDVFEAREGDDPAVARALRHARGNGLPPLDPELALTALQQVMNRGPATVAVADVDWERFAPTFTLARPSRLIEGVPEARAVLVAAEESAQADGQASGVLRERLADLSPEERRQELVTLVCTHAAAILGHGSGGTVEAQRTFRDLGVESMTAVELRNRLNQATGLSLPATLVFEYPTPSALAEHLNAELVQDGTTTVAALHAELDRMDTGLTRVVASETERLQITQRLESLLSKWNSTENSQSGTAETVAEKLESASDDEVFEFLKELGKPS